MIKSEKEREITLHAIKQFTESVAYLANVAADEEQPRIRRGRTVAIEGTIRQLQAEVDEYDALKSGQQRVVPAATFADLPRVLIQTRIAQGISQAEMARQIGVAAEDFKLYEEYGYQNVSFTQILNVMQVLGLEIPASPPTHQVYEETMVASR